MRYLNCFAALCVCACADSGDVPAKSEQPDYSAAIVLFVSPDSQEVKRLRERLGDDFYVAADDAMWYRSNAYELLDSLQIPHAEVRRGAARFLVDRKVTLVSWERVELTWFAVVYDGLSQPTISADVDLRSVLIPLGRALR